MLDQLKSKFRLWFAKVWKVRGGGLYAVGWAAYFLYLEIATIFGEIAEADGVIDFFTGQLIEFVFRFLGDSIANMVQAFIWPVQIITTWPPWGAIGLGIAFFTFDVYLRKPIELWLAGDDAADPDPKSSIT